MVFVNAAGRIVVPIVMITATLTMAHAAPVLVPHRAVYDLNLGDVSDRSGINRIVGRMVYEMNGSACDGYTVGFRFVTQVDTEEFSRLTDQQTTTYEDPELDTFRFVSRSYVDDKLDSETRGIAHSSGEGIEVALEEPEERSLDLARAKFPTAHMFELIGKARSGDSFYQSHIFDGSDGADEVMLTTSVIGDRQEPSKDDSEAAAAGPFAEDAFWPVTIAYFNETETGDELPEYQISFKLYDNGVTRDLAMDYGDFTLNGTLSELEVLDAPDCAR